MSFLDLTQALLDKMKQRAAAAGQDDIQSNMANGGFSGYRPQTSRHKTIRETLRQQPVQDAAADQTDFASQQQGFTGMNPLQWQQPASGYQGMGEPNVWQYQNPGYQQTNYQQTDYQQTAYQQTGYQGWQQTAYQQGMNQQPMGGYQQTAYQQTAWGGNDGGYTAAYQGGAQQAPDNISYMPGNFVGPDGRAYSHVERVVRMTSVASSMKIIDFMRNGESVIVTTEQITDERENQRCLDLLFGAAFTMACTLTRISARDIYLLSPATVMVLPDEGIRRMSDQDVNARWPQQEMAESQGRYGYGGGQRVSGFRDRRGSGRSGYTERYDEGFGGYQTAYAR